MPKIIFKNNVNILAIYLDRTQIQQVILNLLKNSIEALEEAATMSAQIEICLTLNKSNKKVTIFICDNGAGISKAFQPRIFEPYFTTKKQVLV